MDSSPHQTSMVRFDEYGSPPASPDRVATMPSSRTSRRPTSSRAQMPAIAEQDNGSAPELPLKSPRRSAFRPNNNNNPYQPEYPPPAYTSFDAPASRSWSSDTATETDVPPFLLQSPKPRKDRRPDWLVHRGGWRRVVLFSLVGVVCLVALIVGLVVGLRRRGSGGGNDTSPDPASASAPLLFPAGSYAFTTALSNISTACTSNPATFRCYPYTTYTTDPSSSSATFYWTIAATGSSKYTISAAPNPFVPQFTNVSLVLLDDAQPSERLVFSVPVPAAVVPRGPLVDGNDAATTCYYNDAVLSATIWTRRRAEFPVDSTNSSSIVVGNGGEEGSDDFAPWPYAVEIAQTSGAGTGTPDCRDGEGNRVGSFAVTVESLAGDCACRYRNFGLSRGDT